MGRKTYENIPTLNNRQVICLSNSGDSGITLDDIDIIAKYDKIFIAGGAQIYKLAFEKENYIQKVHLSIIRGIYKCDTFFNINWLKDFVIIEHIKYTEFDHYILQRTSKSESQYINLLQDILNTGIIRKGRNGNTKSVFGKHLEFDLRNGFPLLTTKKMFFRGIIEELLFFLRGDTDTKILEEKGINIWKDNTSKEFLEAKGLPYKEGIMGPNYGYNWRFFNAPYDKINAKPTEEGIDQLKNICELIKSDPTSRRIFMTTFNPSQVEECSLHPCHSIVLQFYVEDTFLDMYAYSRSADMFLGIPFNIASYACMLSIIAKVSNLIPRNLIIGIGDAHIYEEHYDKIYEQIKRLPYKFPTLSIEKEISNVEDIEKLQYKDFSLKEYNYHPSIKAKMIA